MAIRMHLLHIIIVAGTFVTQTAGFCSWAAPRGASVSLTLPNTARCLSLSSLRCSSTDLHPSPHPLLTRRRLLKGLAVGGVGISGPQLVSAGDADDEEPDSEVEGIGEGSVGGDSEARVDGGSEAGRSRHSSDESSGLSGGGQSMPKLSSRFAKGQLKTIGPAGPLGPPEASAPAWLAGTWTVTYTFDKAEFPLTKDFAQFKQLLVGSVRSPADAPGEETRVVEVWKRTSTGAQQDTATNLNNYYNAFSKPLTLQTSKGPRTRKVGWMPILTQRGIYEKVNSVDAAGNNWQMIVKEIGSDLSVLATAPLQGVVVNRKSERSEDGSGYVVSELTRVKRLSQGKVKMIETGTGDLEVVTAYIRKSENEVVGRHRVAVYLVPFPGPAGDKYADSAGGAVAVYDWSMSMTRLPKA